MPRHPAVGDQRLELSCRFNPRIPVVALGLADGFFINAGLASEAFVRRAAGAACTYPRLDTAEGGANGQGSGGLG